MNYKLNLKKNKKKYYFTSHPRPETNCEKLKEENIVWFKNPIKNEPFLRSPKLHALTEKSV